MSWPLPMPLSMSLPRSAHRLVPAALLAVSLGALAALPAHAQKVRLATSAGDIVLELDRAKAPKTVDNFLAYVAAGHYDGTVFHRVIDNFMIQGGGMTADMSEKPTRDPVPIESRNGLQNARGTVAMARTSDPNSATAQFFINLKDNAFLNYTAETPRGWGYAVFGKVVAGMDVVDKIRVVPTGNKGPHQNVPLEPVVIRKATLEK
jgi:peptidyl-prolyl cis-trans isomerase A (cyclophilin A)